MKNRLLIIQPSFYRSANKDRSPVRTRHRQLMPLVLPCPAALTPEGWDVQIVDDMVHPLDVDTPDDVRGVPAHVDTEHNFTGY